MSPGRIGRGWLAGVSLVVGLALPAPGFAQGQRYALLVQGASGGAEYASLHRQWLDRLAAVLADDMKFEPASVTVLAERPGPDEERSTADAVRAALGRLAGAMTADDLLFVMLIGHGSGAGPEAKFNLVGPDLTAAEWRVLFDAVPGRLVIVNSTSASFGFLESLAEAGRVVITATNTPAQRYHTQFAEGFIAALTDRAADADQNGRISMFEAFTHASRLVGQHFERAGTMATEHAVLDDTGKGQGRRAGADGDDGAVAEATYLDTTAAPTSSDPELQKLLLRRQVLLNEIDALKRRRASMSEADYDREFEKLAIDLALVSRQIREHGGG
ncbi:MAG TPA: hypothetical protein VMM93_06790 [Vicinamibacterales bacterium]|nr:hypothetical protein [Vicinamibacterales bacterium]